MKVHECVSVQMHTCVSLQVRKCVSVQMRKCVSVQVHKCESVHGSKFQVPTMVKKFQVPSSDYGEKFQSSKFRLW